MQLLSGIGGLVLFCFGVLVIMSFSARIGLVICGFGLALMGYWALANENKDYNF